MDFGNVILLEFTRTSDNTTFIEKYFPRVFATTGYQRFCEVIKSTYFEAVIDIVLVLNAIVIGIQSYPELSGNTVDIDRKCSTVGLLLTKCCANQSCLNVFPSQKLGRFDRYSMGGC